MIFFKNPNYIIISYSFLSGLMILQTTFKSSSMILVLRWSSEGDQTAWRAGKKKSYLIFLSPFQRKNILIFFIQCY
jgi:hypothetical protein